MNGICLSVSEKSRLSSVLYTCANAMCIKLLLTYLLTYWMWYGKLHSRDMIVFKILALYNLNHLVMYTYLGVLKFLFDIISNNYYKIVAEVDIILCYCWCISTAYIRHNGDLQDRSKPLSIHDLPSTLCSRHLWALFSSRSLEITMLLKSNQCPSGSNC